VFKTDDVGIISICIVDRMYYSTAAVEALRGPGEKVPAGVYAPVVGLKVASLYWVIKAVVLVVPSPRTFLGKTKTPAQPDALVKI
jgi:hypothetical protein